MIADVTLTEFYAVPIVCSESPKSLRADNSVNMGLNNLRQRSAVARQIANRYVRCELRDQSGALLRVRVAENNLNELVEEVAVGGAQAGSGHTLNVVVACMKCWSWIRSRTIYEIKHLLNQIDERTARPLLYGSSY